MQASAGAELTYGRGRPVNMVNFCRGPERSFGSAVIAAGFVIAMPTADEDQRHQPDTQAKRNNNPQPHREPTGGADLRIAEARPQGGNFTDDCHNNGGAN